MAASSRRGGKRGSRNASVDRARRKELAQESMQIMCEKQGYVTPKRKKINLKEELHRMVTGTVVYPATPEWHTSLQSGAGTGRSKHTGKEHHKHKAAADAARSEGGVVDAAVADLFSHEKHADKGTHKGMHKASGAAATAQSSGGPAVGKAEKKYTVSVWDSRTLEAARRCVQEFGDQNVAVLNFASARNPGGGFLNGSLAQEESLAGSSALFRSLTLPACRQHYYEFHRPKNEGLYSDATIYSPSVAVFRCDSTYRLLEEPFVVGVVTAPAVNAGIYRERQGNSPATNKTIEDAMRQRIRRVLAVFQAQGHRTIVLGAWGCGVFRNEPEDVARWFADILGTHFDGVFDHTVFAVPGGKGKGGSNADAFRAVFKVDSS